MLHRWVKQAAADPQHAFPGQRQMKPEQIEIDRLRKEVARLKRECFSNLLIDYCWNRRINFGRLLNLEWSR